MTKNGLFLYGITYHISQYASSLVRQKLNYQLYPEAMAKSESPVRVINWGPKETIEGHGVNIQPDGSSAMWIIGDNLGIIGEAFVYFGTKGARSSGYVLREGITTRIPQEVIRTPGKYAILSLKKGAADRGWFVCRAFRAITNSLY